MTIDEAIKHSEEVAERYEKMEDSHDDKLKQECLQCAADHRQLAEWLKELKNYKWVSVDESLPSDNKPCVVMTKKNGLGVSRLMGRNRVEWTLFGEPVLYWLPIPEPPETTKG